MPKKMILLSISVVLILAGTAAAEDFIDLVKKGNEALNAREYKKALEYYHKAETQIPESPALDYNLAGALYHQENYEETLEKYQRALNTNDPDLEAKAQYNLGNTYYRMQDYQKAIERFQETLKSNPDDMDAKYNLELARKMLKENSKPQQQEKQKQQQDQKQENKQDQGEDDQEQKDSQQQQDKQDQQDQDQKQQQQQSKPDNKKMSKEDAERILNALRDDEQDIQDKLKRQVAIGTYKGKDW